MRLPRTVSALVINRLHYRVLDRLKAGRGLIFSWAHEAAEADALLTHILDSHYNTPKRTRRCTRRWSLVQRVTRRCSPPGRMSVYPAFAFEDDMEANNITESNVADRARRFYDVVAERAAAYPASARLLLLVQRLAEASGHSDRADPHRHGRILGWLARSQPFGDDFAFGHAEVMFDNMERLMAYINGPAGRAALPRPLRVQFGTLSEYFALLRQRLDPAEVGAAWRTKRRSLF